MTSRRPGRSLNAAVIRDAIIIGVSVALALAAAKSGVMANLLPTAGIPAWLASLVAGILYSSVFTVAPATVALVQLASVAPVGEIVVLGGLGAMLGDTIVFHFFQGALATWIARYRRPQFQRWRWRKRWWWIVVGALIIASPLPDEIGIALMGLTPLQQRWFFPLAFGLNSAGIFIIVLVGKYG